MPIPNRTLTDPTRISPQARNAAPGPIQRADLELALELGTDSGVPGPARIRRRLAALVTTLVLAPMAFAGESADQLGPEMPEIVARSIEHHGGDRYENSRTELDICSKSGCFHVESRVEGGRFEHQVRGQVRAGEQRVRATNDELDWWLDGERQTITAEDRQRLRDWVMARVYFPFLPYRLGDPSVRYRDHGEETWPAPGGGTRQLHKVEIGFVAGSSTDADDGYLYWFDPETARLEQFSYTYSGDPGGLRFRQLRHHRRVGGILFFDQENLGTEAENPGALEIDPAFVDTLRAISTVRLENLRVEPLESGAHSP